jgi:hypothetical protein
MKYFSDFSISYTRRSLSIARFSGLKATKGVVKADQSNLKLSGANIIAGGAQCGFAGVRQSRDAPVRMRRRTLKCGGLEKGQRTSSHCSCFSAPSPSAVAPWLRLGCASEGVQEPLFGSFLQTEIPESLKFGTFAGEVHLSHM